MQVNPKEVEIIKTKNPSNPEKTRIIMLRRIRIPKDNKLQLIFEICFEKSFAIKIARKKAKIPEIKIAARIM